MTDLPSGSYLQAGDPARRTALWCVTEMTGHAAAHILVLTADSLANVVRPEEVIPTPVERALAGDTEARVGWGRPSDAILG